MLKKLIFTSLFMLITTGEVFACAMCMGSNPNDKYFLYVVGVFVLAIYIPMFYLFKTFMKFKNVNNIDLPKDH